MDIQAIKDESGVRGEDRVQEILDSFCKGKYIHNFIIRYKTFFVEEASTEIDFLLVMNKYVYCLEVKNWNTIKDYDYKRDEYHVRIKHNNRHFRSPIVQNKLHKEHLVELLGLDEDRIVCISIICTDDDTDKKYVKTTCTEKDKNLVRLEQLKSTIEKYEQEDVSDLPARNQLCESLDRLNWGMLQAYIEKHKEYVKRFKGMSKEEKNLCRYYVCDKCGRMLDYVEKGTYGSYAKCPGFPVNCNKKTISITQIAQYESSNNEERLIYRMFKSEYENEIENIKSELSEIRSELEQIRKIRAEQENMLVKVIADKNKAIEETKMLRDIIPGNQYRSMKNSLEMECSSLSKMNEQLAGDLKLLQLGYSNLKEKYNKTLDARVKALIAAIMKK